MRWRAMRTGGRLTRVGSQAARLALANTIDLANVKRVQIKHVTAIPTLEKEIQSHLTVRAPKWERTQVGMRLKQDPS